MANKIIAFKNNIIRGDTPLIQFSLTVNGNAANLSGYTATFTATTSSAPTTGDVPAIQLSQAGDTTGVLNFQLLRGQILNDTTILVPGTTYHWDVQLDNGQSGAARRSFTVLRGTFGVDQDYTVI